MMPIKSIAIIGAGPAGAITVDALAKEQEFDMIKVFERRERAGGCWLDDPEDHVQKLEDLGKIAARNVDEPLPIPAELPTMMPHSTQYRFSDTSIYPSLETNIDAFAMSFSQEPFPEEKSPLNIQRHGPDSPFRHWKTIQRYVQGLLERRGYQDWVVYNTTVELIHKDKESGKWTLTLRKPLENREQDFWWTETFDAVVVATGHYQVPFIPHVPGLIELAQRFPGMVEHSKAWRDPEKYRGQRVIVVGASVSGADIAHALASITESPLHCSVRGRYHPYFSDHAFQHPQIMRHGAIVQICSDDRTVIFADGTQLRQVDRIIFATGYSWTLPFCPPLAATIRQNRLPHLYQHVFWRDDARLAFVGAIAAGFTFKVFEWQAVLVARFFAGRLALPSQHEQRRWEEDRVAAVGDGVPFTTLYPHFEAYFEELRRLAGEPINGKGRPLPPFDSWWQERFNAAHLLRIAMWKRVNEDARARLDWMKGETETKCGSQNRDYSF